MTDERTSQPDYGPSLEDIARRLENLGRWAKQMSETPTLRLTPQSLAHEIGAAATNSRIRDQQLLEGAAGKMEAASSRIDAMIARSHSVVQQEREVWYNRVVFAALGMLAFAILPGAVARSLPNSWAMPERLAARTMRLNMWQAGQRMMLKADPARWGQIVAREQQRAREGEK